MKPYTINGEPCSFLQKTEHKLKQLQEAESLLQDLDWRLSWALDFSCYNSINEALNPSLEVIDDSLSEIQNQVERLQEQIEEYKSYCNIFQREWENEHEFILN